MNALKYYGYLILNLQLMSGFIYSYHYLHRHIIIDHVMLFMILVVLFANLTFFISTFIKIQSFRSVFSIIISVICISIATIHFNRNGVDFNFSDLLLIILYSIIRLLLYITTPIAVCIELFLRWKINKNSSIAKN